MSSNSGFLNRPDYQFGKCKEMIYISEIRQHPVARICHASGLILSLKSGLPSWRRRKHVCNIQHLCHWPFSTGRRVWGDPSGRPNGHHPQ